MRYPLVDDALAGEVCRTVGVELGDDVETIVTAIRAWLPAGPTAKFAAIAAGDDVPGPDPAHALAARLAGSPLGWSCWPICTGIGGVLAAAGHDVSILVEHRRGRQPAPVDYHSVLVVDGEMLDPYLGPGAPVPLGGDVTRHDAWAQWLPGDAASNDRPDHLGVRGGGGVYRYRELGRGLDPADVAAFCAISITHSGVGDRPYVQWVADGALHMIRGARPGEDAHAEYRVTVGTNPFAQTREVRGRGAFEDLLERFLPSANGPGSVAPTR